MTCWKQQENWKDRRRKKIKLILHYGKRQRRNILCDGKAPGVLDFPAGILNARQWQQNISALNSIYMEVAWTFYSRIMKVRLLKVQSAIMFRLFVTGSTII